MREDAPFEMLPPHNSEAEEAVLGSLLIDPVAIEEVAGALVAESFYHPRHRDIYAAMLALRERGMPTDFELVCDELARTDRLDRAGGVSYLGRLVTVTPTSLHAQYYAEIVARTARNRRIIAAAGRIAAIGYEDPADPIAAHEAVQSEITTAFGVLNATGRGAVHVREILAAYLEEIDPDRATEEHAATSRVPSGFLDLDRLLGGFGRSDLVILAGRPGQGKTALGLNIARNAAVTFGLTTLIYSAEMSAHQLAGRFLSAESGVDATRIRAGRLSGAEIQLVGEAMDLIGAAPIWVDDQPGAKLGEIRARSTKFAAEHGLDLIVVDYLQLLHDTRSRNRVEEISAISAGLKGLARELNVPVLALSQLNRAVEQRTSHVPMLSDLAQSGSIEQDADVVLFLAKDEDPDSERKGVVDVHIGKNRNGPTGIVSLLFIERTTRFHDLALRGDGR